MTSNGEWGEYRKVVLSEIEKMQEAIEKLQEKQAQQSIEVAVMQSKMIMVTAGISTAVAAVLTAILQLVIK